MSESWKVPWADYLRMIHGIKGEEYSPHCFNFENGMVIFRTKRERKLLEDVISWANDKVMPERELSSGEPRKKKAKVEVGREGPSIGQLILQNPTVISNLRTKNADYLQGRCPSCAEVGGDSDDNHFWIHEESGGYGCVTDCMEGGHLTRVLVKIMSSAGILESDTSQKEQKVETESVVEQTVLKERKKEETLEEALEQIQAEHAEEVSKRTNSRLIKNTDHHTVEHVLPTFYDMVVRKFDLHVYKRIETSKTTGKETITEVEVPNNDVRSLWQAIVRHIMPSPVIGGSFEVAELWDTMNMDRTKQGEKYRRWNFPSDILILLGVLEKDGNRYTVRRAYR